MADLFKANMYYPSSQRYNLRGRINKKVEDLNVKYWKYSECGINHNRDLNASLNILEKGLKNNNK